MATKKVFSEVTAKSTPVDADLILLWNSEDLVSGEQKLVKSTKAQFEATIWITASQVSDFDTEVGNNTDVTANTAKISYNSTASTKLWTIETNADVTDTANVTSAWALMDSELTSIADVKALDQSVVSGSSPTFTNANITEATDKNYVTDAEATVIGNTSGTNTWDQSLTWYTQDTDADVSGNTRVLDEDNMVSDSATKVPTQQSVKAYVDANWGWWGSGDMAKAVYDPTSIEWDAFDMDNMVEWTTTKILTATERTKLSWIEVSATADQSDAEIETAYDNQVAAVSQVEAEAGTVTDIRRRTPERVKQAIEALSPSVTTGDISTATFYDNTWGVALTTSYATVNLDTTMTNNDTGLFSIASDVITIADAWFYSVSYGVWVNQSTGTVRWSFSVRLQVDTGWGYSTIDGTEMNQYFRISSGAWTTASKTITYEFGAWDVIKMQAKESIDGVTTTSDWSWISITQLKWPKWDTWPAWSWVDTSGTPVANDFARFTDADTIEGRSYSEVRTDLWLVIGTDVQAYDADTTKNDVANTFTALQTVEDLKIASNKHVYFNAVTDNGNSSTADTVDRGTGNIQKSTLTGNCTYTFTAPDWPWNYQLIVIQDGTGSRIATRPWTVKRPWGTAPTLTTTASATDIISFLYDGTSYFWVEVLALS